MRAFCFFILAAAAIQLPSPGTLSASPPALRFAAVFEETLDGTRRDHSSAEAELVRILVERGAVMVDESQARKLRADAAALAGGRIPLAITGLDADLIVAAVSSAHRVESPYLAKRLFRASAVIEGQLISSESAKIVRGLRAEAAGMGFSETQAAERALREAAAILAAEVWQGAESRKRAFELLVSGAPDASAVDGLAKTLETIPSVTRVSVQAGGKEAWKIEVEAANAGARELSAAIAARPELGLRVFGYSDGSIKADYVLGRSQAKVLIIEPFRGDKRYPWAGAALAQVLANELASSEILRVTESSSRVTLGAEPRRWAAAVTRAGLDPSRALVLSGRSRAVGQNLQIEARLLALPGGTVLLADQKTCTPESLAECAGALGRDLVKRLPERLEKSRDFVIPSGAQPLRIVELSAEGLFPARFGLPRRPIGQIALENRSQAVLEDVRLTVRVPGLLPAPLETGVPDLPANKVTTVPVELELPPGALLAARAQQSFTLTAEIEYLSEGYRSRQERSAVLILHPANALGWSVPESIAAFVTPGAEPVRKIGRAWYQSLSDETSRDPRAPAAAAFRALGLLGVRYTPDPHSPGAKSSLDHVQFPQETLNARGGDCEDLVVLLAAAAESAGRRALIVTTPEHALAAIATDLPPHAAHLASSTADDLLIHEDQLWIPVEATLAGKTFAAAWEAGAREIARWKKTPGALGIVDLRAAWTKFPPIAATSSAAPGLETLESLGSIVGGELEQLEARRRRGFEQELSRLGAGEATEIEIARGRLLAYAGREREARAIFEALAAKPDAAAAGHNNLGNLSLAAGDPESARKHYSAALAVAREKTRVRMNLAIVALALGDEKGFAEQVHACLEAGDEDAVLVLSRLGMGPAEATRGAGAAQPPVPLATHLYWL